MLFLAGKIALAQSSIAPGPAETALSGAGVARAGEIPFARLNPALVGTVGWRAYASASPSSLGITGYVDGSAVATLPIDSALSIGVSIQGLSAASYRQVQGGGMVAFQPDWFITVGAAVWLNSVSVDGYGSATAPTVDVGVLAHRHFLACILDGVPPRTDAASGLRVVRALAAAQATLDASRAR